MKRLLIPFLIVLAIVVLGVSFITLTNQPLTVPHGITDTPNGDAPGESTPQPVVVADGLGSSAYVSTIGTHNPWTPAQAVAWEWQQINTSRPFENVQGLCAHQTSVAYGWGGYGYVSAKDGGNAVPYSERHSINDFYSIPAGALLYYLGGQYGHVVIALGNDLFGSNDVLRSGRIDAVSGEWFAQNWGMSFNFWTIPNFPNGFGRNPNPAPIVIAPINRPLALPAVSLSQLKLASHGHVKYCRSRLVRKALNGTSSSCYYTLPLHKRYRKFQRSIGANPTGYPTLYSLTILAKKSGTFVVVK